MFLQAGGSDAEAEQFLAMIPASSAVQFEIQVDEKYWKQYEHDDGGPAVGGALGTYTVQDDVVHEVDAQDGCRTDFQVALQGEGQLTVRVLEADTDPCEHFDQLIEHAIFESAPFVRVG